jgi:hypothetical protein
VLDPAKLIRPAASSERIYSLHLNSAAMGAWSDRRPDKSGLPFQIFVLPHLCYVK